jgi:putative peptidoglycan lipid II flippase
MAPGLLGLGLIFHVSRALYALERGRLAVLATSAGWATVMVASWVACLALVPAGGDGPATLRALAVGNTTGMLVAGVALLAVLRRAAGAEALTGLVRTLAVLLVGGALGALAGRWTVDAVERLTGGAGGAVVAAAAGGAVALALVLALVWCLDRSTLTGLLRRSGGGTTGGGDAAGTPGAVGAAGAGAGAAGARAAGAGAAIGTDEATGTGPAVPLPGSTGGAP